MEIPRNAFKRALAEGRVQIGLWSSLCSSIAAEVLAHAGFDWIVIDTEHAPNEVPGVLAQLQAMTGGAAQPVVRPAWNDPVLIKRILDVGAQSVIVPYVQNADEAGRAVAAVRYPPRGIRGVGSMHRAIRYGRVDDYFRQADGEMCVVVQLETKAALGNLEAIARVDGIDGIFIGPSDLAASMDRIGNPGHPEVQAEIEDAARKCRAAGKPAGILAPAEADARRYLEWGYTFVAVGADLQLLARQSEALAKKFKSG